MSKLNISQKSQRTNYSNNILEIGISPYEAITPNKLFERVSIDHFYP